MDTPLISKWAMRSTLAIAGLVLIASLSGLFSYAPYALETQNWRLQAQGQDIGNIIGAIVLVISGLFAKKGSLRAFSGVGGHTIFLYAKSSK